MRVERIKLEVIAGRVVEKFSDGAIEDSIIGRQEASQFLTCREGEQIKVIVKKDGYTFKVVAERQSANFFCHIKERDEDRAIAEYYYKYSASDIEKVAASPTSSKPRKETGLTAVNLERRGVRKLKKLTRRLKARTQKESLFWVAGMTEESRHRFLTSNGFRMINDEITPPPRARKNHQAKLLEYRRAAAGRGWWRVGPAERRRAAKKWYR